MRDDLDFEDIKRLLEERYADIQAGSEARRKEVAPVELDQASVGRLSRMGAMQQQAMAQASARRSEDVGSNLANLGSDQDKPLNVQYN